MSERMHEITEEAISKDMRKLKRLWLQMLVVPFVYVYVCHMAGDQVFAAYRPALPIVYVKWVLCCAAAAAIALGYYLRVFSLRVRSGKSTDRIIRRAARLGKSPILVKYNTSVILTIAIVQYAPLFGVVLFFLGGGIEVLYVFAAASLGTTLFLKPRRKELDRLSLQWPGTVRDVSQ